MIFLGFRGGRASPPKRGLGSLFRFVLPAIEQIRSNPVTSTRLRNIPALNTFLHHLPFLFRGTIYAWFSAHVASCFGGPDFTQLRRLVLAGSTTSEHTLTGKHALTNEGRAIVERCLLFLKSDLEFQWPATKLRLWYPILRL